MDQIRKRRIFLNQLNQDLQIEFNSNSVPMNAHQIEEIARLNPVKISDFQAIKGLGAKFQETYGQLIIDRLQSFNSQSTQLIDDTSIKTTISELEKRLINISKRNRLLYVAKTSPKTSYDLSQLNQDELTALLFDNQKIKLVDLEDEDAKNKYNSLNDILKNVNKAYRETGNFDLYIATPFVIGEFIQDPFTVRAPLALFPINLIINNKTIIVEADSSKDVLINTNLIIAAQKFLKSNRPLIPMNLEEVTKETFLLDLLEAYKLQGLQIQNTNEELKSFEPKTIESFKQLKPGLFEVENVALLGYFPILSTSIQRDYVSINQLDSFPPHVLTLLETISEVHDEDEEVVELDEVKFNEEHLAYINPLNTSQEQAQLQIKKGQHLVIQGPPGTGKSQTISNVIAQSVYDNKNVLMVSEKKAAIDVVYSRLSHLNQYALILDNINDKKNFYAQCEQLFVDNNAQSEIIDLNKQNTAMNELIEDASKLKDYLTSPLIDDLTLLDLYPITHKIDYTQEEIFKEYDQLKKMVDPKHFSSYKTLKDLDLTNFNDQVAYLTLTKSIPNLKDINTSLSDYDVMTLKSAYPEIKKQVASFKESGFVFKLFNKSKVDSTLEPLRKLLPSVTIETLDSIDTLLNNYPQISKPVELTLSPELLTLIDQMMKTFNEDEKNSLNRLINFIGFELIQDYENKHRDLADLVDSFPQLINSFNASADEKSNLLQQTLAQKLHENRLQLKASKRSLEMQRIIERKRKWSISKFVDRFYVELFDGIKIWLLTPDVVSEIFPLKPDLFDVLIFDEASQLYIEKAIPSILRSKQVVIAGDSKQLRPSAFGVGRYDYDEEIEDDFIDATAALDEESLLDLARFKFSNMTLNYHYRSLYEELIAFSNAAFYKNQLIVSPNALPSITPPLKRIKVDDGQWIKRSNQAESIAVVNLIKEISETREDNETIGVITFNATQRALIEKNLEELAASDKAFGDFYAQESTREKNNQDLSLFVKNIENVQGDERDIIIFSITYAQDENGKVPSFFGWLSQQGGENRLNVAVTRAKKQIYVVTSIEPHQLPVTNSAYRGPSLLRDYLSYSKAVSEQDMTNLTHTLNQLSPLPTSATAQKEMHPLVKEVVSFLEKQGYQTKYQVGIGAFTIELAVYKDDLLIAGLEFDHSVYSTNLSDRARDIHQPNYLKARGWKIIRLFSYHAYHHREQFFEELLSKLEM